MDSKKGIKQRGGFRVDGCGGGGEGGEGEGMRVTAVAHPVTYLNKLLLGGGDGRMLLVNIAKNKLVFSFKGLFFFLFVFCFVLFCFVLFCFVLLYFLYFPPFFLSPFFHFIFIFKPH